MSHNIFEKKVIIELISHYSLDIKSNNLTTTSHIKLLLFFLLLIDILNYFGFLKVRHISVRWAHYYLLHDI